MEERRVSRTTTTMPDSIFEFVVPYIDDPIDRNAASLVCRRWYDLDALTRKHVTIALCYSTTPDQLLRRFPHLESLKLKGKPRAAMFNLIPEYWGGYVTPWVEKMAAFNCLKSLHFRRMIIGDSDLEVLTRARGRGLQVLKLDKCSGFTTDGLLLIVRLCRNLKTLFLEESQIDDKDGEWLGELARNNTVLETLNFYMTEIVNFQPEDLELIARNCPSLVSVKISDCEILKLVGFFNAATSLEEFSGGSFNEEDAEIYSTISLPLKLRRLGLMYLGQMEMPIIFPFASLLKKLDLLCALLNTEDHCTLIQRCPNLEVLETRNVIGDGGLEVLARYCKRLKRLRIERGADEQEMEDEQGRVSQRGLIALSRGCVELEYMAVYVSDITNAALNSIGTYCKNLCDFRLVLLDKEETITDLPLDDGVRALLRGCEMLRRFALYLRPGGLTDVGLGYIGRYSPNVRWMLLGHVGHSDEGLLALSAGCPKLQKLEMRGCCFSEHALAIAVTKLTSLRYLWVQGYRVSGLGQDLCAMARPYWNIELIAAPANGGETAVGEQPAQILAYYSLAGPRMDVSEGVILLDQP